MRLTPWEEERLLIFTAAELARRHRAAGILLSAPEAIALICDAMLEAARAGASYEAVEAAGRRAVSPTRCSPGSPRSSTRCASRSRWATGPARRPARPARCGGRRPGRDPTGDGRARGTSSDAPGTTPADVTAIDLVVRNGSTRVVRVSSHYPFDRVNRRLEFDRAAAAGHRLDLPAGSNERWAPGETRTVRLVRFRGEAGR